MKARHAFIALLLVFGVGLKAGLHLERGAHQAERAELKATQAESARIAATAALRELEDARRRGDALTEQLRGSERQIEVLSKEKSDALKRSTTGRACLGTAALRVLDTAPGLRVAGMPQATGSAAGADGPVATDTDIGQWSIAAGAQFERCRERLGTLIEWHREQQ